MPSSLQQVQLNYDQVQDRLILTFMTQDFCEYRFWITRHILIAFWEILHKLEQALETSKEQKIQEKQQATENIRQEKQQPEANKYGMRMSRRPLGEEPLLLFKIIAKPSEQGFAFFHLEDIKGQSIEFNGDSAFITALSQLVQKTMPQTNWGLILKSDGF